MDRVFGGFFRRFNAFFDRLSNNYVGAVRRAVRGSIIVLVLYAGFLGLTLLGFQQVPNGFVPAQDKYYLVGIAQLPSGASLDRTEAVVKRDVPNCAGGTWSGKRRGVSWVVGKRP